MYVDTPVLKA